MYRPGFSPSQTVSSSRRPKAGFGSSLDLRPSTLPKRRASSSSSSGGLGLAAFSHRAYLSGRLGGTRRVSWCSARYAVDTGEAIVNPTVGASSLSAQAGTDAVTTPFPPRDNWSGLAGVSGQLGVALDDDALERFARYRDLLLERSAQFNLTAIREPEEIERRLFLDAIAMLPELDRLTGAGSDRAARSPRLLDVGTGAGFPGLVLKIARPHLDVTLADATAKKVAFVNEVITVLGLERARAVQGRAEELGQDSAYRARFDIATARALASLPVLLEYVVPFLTIGGTALLPKGLEIEEELRRGRGAARMLGAEIVSTMGLSVPTTRLVVVRKIAPTAGMYPRRVGIPSRDPLGERS